MFLLGPLLAVTQWYLAGVRDSLAIPTALVVMYQSRRIQRLFVMGTLLNVGVLIGSIFFFRHAALPGTRALAGPMPPHLDDAVAWIDAGIFTAYNALVVLPVYALALIFSTLWHQDIAERAYRLALGKRRVTKGLKRTMVDMVYRALMIAVFLAGAVGVSFVPAVGEPVYFLLLSWVYAFDCFEYLWVSLGWRLRTRVDYVEHRWAYFAGFGAWLAALTWAFDSVFVGLGAYLWLFPLTITMAAVAAPQPAQPSWAEHGVVGTRLPIFSYSRSVCDWAIEAALGPAMNRVAGAAAG